MKSKTALQAVFDFNLLVSVITVWRVVVVEILVDRSGDIGEAVDQVEVALDKLTKDILVARLIRVVVILILLIGLDVYLLLVEIRFSRSAVQTEGDKQDTDNQSCFEGFHDAIRLLLNYEQMIKGRTDRQPF